jgi:hypothetical protein
MKSKWEIDESIFAKKLSNAFEEFDDFFKNERHRAGKILWRIDSHLEFKIPAAYAASRTRPTAKVHEICLTKYPVDYIDAFVVAHEITHTIFKEENNSLRICSLNPRLNHLNDYLSTMLEDYSVDLFLCNQYHFNLLSIYTQRLSTLNTNVGVEPFDSLERLECAILLANGLIKWRLICDPVALHEWDEFLNRYKEVCPRIFSMGCELADIAQNIDTLEERKDVFLKIVKNCNLYNDPLEKFLCLE